MGATRSAGMHTRIGNTPALRSGLEIRLLHVGQQLQSPYGYRLPAMASCLPGWIDQRPIPFYVRCQNCVLYFDCRSIIGLEST